jgi:hypothetical protein
LRLTKTETPAIDVNDITPNPETRIALFQRKEIRRTIHNNEWWFVVEDVVLALIESRDPKQYIQRMKQRDPELGKGWVQIVHTQRLREYIVKGFVLDDERLNNPGFNAVEFDGIRFQASEHLESRGFQP